MNKRIYNILFHTHTISGIVISVVLYIIFFAGSFALFRNEISTWEKGRTTKVELSQIDFDKIINELGEDYNLTGRKIYFIPLLETGQVKVWLEPSNIPNVSEEDLKSELFYLDIQNFTKKNRYENYNLGDFLFRLHFLGQIPGAGLYISGFVSFFFLFALITGLIIHWDKIITNFFLFRNKGKIKIKWTDTHTLLGVIGFPFQLMYAVTGAFFGLSILVLLPGYFLYENDTDKLMADLRPERAQVKWEKLTDQTPTSFNKFVAKYTANWEEVEPTHLEIENYQGINMEYSISGMPLAQNNFFNIAKRTASAYNLNDLKEIKPNEKASYIYGFQKIVNRLHFADYGGFGLKLLYALLSFITCVVILSGVMIWLTARKTKQYTEKQQKYQAKVCRLYMAICLSLYPVIALSFIFSRFLSESIKNQQAAYYIFFFILWFLLSFFFFKKRNNTYVFKKSLLWGSVLGICIPIINGILTQNWIWNTIQSQYSIFMIDSFWLILSAVGFFILYQIKKQSTNF
ncbi:PepSY domain-containing protein [Weeksellaceae bacterium TAE3-ERU29]|nr:PepSY domain-containing protein [Weeksellaceae bacterium TAE3-ERU29]